MPTPLQMLITDAGLAAIVAAEASGTDQVTITQIGLSNAPFVVAPTLTALPSQFKLLNTVSGQEIAPNVIHLTAYDTSNDSYDITGFGLYDDNGVLIAVYSHASEPVMTKAELAFALIATDIAFTNNIAAVINFGGALFLYPPASETVPGIARFATQAEVNNVVDGPDAHRAVVTDKTLRARLAAFIAGVNLLLTAMANSITALSNRTITGAGAAQGGGDLTANRVITVEQAADADLTGASLLKVVTPGVMGLVRDFTAQGRFRLFGLELKWGSFSIGANGSVGVTFPVGFQSFCGAAIAWGSAADPGDQDNYVHAVAGTQNAGGFTAHNGHGAMTGNYFAIGS